ncbi:MAG: hypothetical protein ABI653_03500 [Bacteroidota bacterium]
MKNLLASVLLFSLLSACKGNPETNAAGDTTNHSQSNEKMSSNASSAGSGNCASLLLFKEGAVINGHTLDADGKETQTSVTTVTKVSNVNGSEVSEVEMKTHSTMLGDKTFTGKYMCDGKMLSYDLSGMLAGLQKAGAKFETPIVQFPISVTDGETLPDANYSFTMAMGSKTLTVHCTIKNRKVVAKESVTTPAGTFEAYKITSETETQTDFGGMDEKTKAMMDAVKSKTPKISYVMWYVPNITVVKMQIITGDKVSSTTEITAIK